MEPWENELLALMKYDVANVYDFSILQLLEATDKKEISRFFIKRTETRRNKYGYWKQVGGPETVMHQNGRQVFAIKTVFRFVVETCDIETDWFVTEYVLDEFYRVQHNIPREPEEYVICVLERLHQGASTSSSSMGKLFYQDKTEANEASSKINQELKNIFEA